MTSHVESQVQAAIAAARAKAQQDAGRQSAQKVNAQVTGSTVVADLPPENVWVEPAARDERKSRERAEFAVRRSAGLVTRKKAKLARRCAVCDRPLKGAKGRACSRGCGARLCRTRHIPLCADVHGGQCVNRPEPEGD